jgi:hypothetical protein
LRHAQRLLDAGNAQRGAQGVVLVLGDEVDLVAQVFQVLLTGVAESNSTLVLTPVWMMSCIRRW